MPRYALALLASALMLSCTTLPQLAEVVEVDPAGWFSPSEIRFTVDEAQEYKVDMSILLRYDSTIWADSVELMVTTIAPDSVMWSERFTLRAPHNKQAISLVESPYRRNIEWGQSGEYRVVIQPQHVYRGICAVGINIIEQQ